MAEAIEIAHDVAYLRTTIVNVYFVGNKHSWVLIDTGTPGSAQAIRDAAVQRFGATRPHAILLTHGHFDHASCALELARGWGVPVYAHRLEFPYLTGQSAYPQKDPTVGGAMAFFSRFFPSRTSNISEVLVDLPESRLVPGLDGWMWIETPGHAPGHVSYWREQDHVLIGGDVMTTVDVDSWVSMVTWSKQISNPPAPFTFDWEKAHASVNAVSELRPRVLACGHGDPMTGADLPEQIEQFAKQFRPPAKGRYTEEAAVANQHGVVYLPPAPNDKLPRVAAGVVAGVFLLGSVLYSRRAKRATNVRDSL